MKTKYRSRLGKHRPRLAPCDGDKPYVMTAYGRFLNVRQHRAPKENAIETKLSDILDFVLCRHVRTKPMSLSGGRTFTISLCKMGIAVREDGTNVDIIFSFNDLIEAIQGQKLIPS